MPILEDLCVIQDSICQPRSSFSFLEKIVEKAGCKADQQSLLFEILGWFTLALQKRVTIATGPPGFEAILIAHSIWPQILIMGAHP